MVEVYITIRVIAEKLGITPRQIQILYSNGKILGTVKFDCDRDISVGAECL